MWELLEKLARPPLSRVLVEHALVEHARAGAQQRASKGGAPPSDAAAPFDAVAQALNGAQLRQALIASEACWQALHFTLGQRRWRRVRAALHRQRRILYPTALRPVEPDWLHALTGLARSARHRRSVQRLQAAIVAREPHQIALRLPSRRSLSERTETLPGKAAGRLVAALEKRARWAAALDAAAPDDATVLRGIVRIYAKTRRHLNRAPRSARARRWLAQQRQLLDMLGIPVAADPVGPLEHMAAGAARLEALLSEDAWLRTIAQGTNKYGLSRRDATRLAKLARTRRKDVRPDIDAVLQQAFAPSPSALAAALPWECFRRAS